MSDLSGNKAELFKELSKESDRGAVILACSYFEEALKGLINIKLHDEVSDKLRKDLFEGFGPLSSLSGRVKIAYGLGLISPVEMDALKLVLKIRNKYAHYNSDIDLDQFANDVSKTLQLMQTNFTNQGVRANLLSLCAILLIIIADLRPNKVDKVLVANELDFVG